MSAFAAGINPPPTSTSNSGVAKPMNLKDFLAKLTCLATGHLTPGGRDWHFTSMGVLFRCSRCGQVAEIKGLK
jgi:hypothetical protein